MLSVRIALAVALLLPTFAAAKDLPKRERKERHERRHPRPFDLITPKVLLQGWVTMWDQDEDTQADPAGYGDPESDPGFSLQRARLGLEGGKGPVSFDIEIGNGARYDVLKEEEPLIGLVTANGSVGWKVGPGKLSGTLGLMRVPVSREQQIASGDLVFQERSVGTEWTSPDYDVGAVVDYDLDLGFRVRAGIFNGNDNPFGDDNAGMTYLGRIEYAKNDAYRTYDPAGEMAIGVGGDVLYDDGLGTKTLQTGGDVLARIWRMSFFGDARFAHLTPESDAPADPAVQATTDRLGVSAQLGYTQPLPHGALELAVRFASFDDARGLKDNGDVATLHGGLVWHEPLPGVDVGATYVHRFELQGRGLHNDTLRLTTQFRFPFQKSWRMSREGREERDERPERPPEIVPVPMPVVPPPPVVPVPPVVPPTP